MKFELRIKRSVEKELNKIPFNFYTKIANFIFLLANNPYSSKSKKLKENIYRIRVGNYRVIYSINKLDKTVVITKVGHRKEVYR